LLASCDGEVVLHGLLLHVTPMRVYEGDVATDEDPLATDGALFVTGSIHRGARVEALDDIYIAGVIHEAEVVNRGGSIVVMGSVLVLQRDVDLRLKSHGKPRTLTCLDTPRSNDFSRRSLPCDCSRRLILTL